MDYFNRETSEPTSMEVDEQAKITFLEMARWTKFLAIIGFIMLGLIVIVGFCAGLAINSSPAISSQLGILAGLGTIGIILYFLVIAALMYYPAYALYKYSRGIKIALATNNKQKFNEAIVYLKNVFIYYGIITIVILGIYGLMIIMMVGLGALAR